jgi:Tfp pilus assembly protein PilX
MRRKSERGAALVVALITLMVVMLITGAVMQSLLTSRKQMLVGEQALQSAWLAEAGLVRGSRALEGDASYRGETWDVQLGEGDDVVHGLVTIDVSHGDIGSGPRTVTATATYPAGAVQQVTVQRTTTVSVESRNRSTRNQERAP